MGFGKGKGTYPGLAGCGGYERHREVSVRDIAPWNLWLGEMASNGWRSRELLIERPWCF